MDFHWPESVQYPLFENRSRLDFFFIATTVQIAYA